ncbi:hypothetical protein Q9233_009143 [Columba guinea]|nr:hypothetical protein Q9233_009143 [Columba guinea]
MSDWALQSAGTDMNSPAMLPVLLSKLVMRTGLKNEELAAASRALPRAFSYVKFLVKSNWGNPKYTCIYRVRVHGKMAKPESLS